MWKNPNDLQMKVYVMLFKLQPTKSDVKGNINQFARLQIADAA